MSLTLGSKVLIKVSQSYLKTSDPMPMLRPPDLVSFEESGIVLALLPRGMVEVKFRKGTFLLELSHLTIQRNNS